MSIVTKALLYLSKTDSETRVVCSDLAYKNAGWLWSLRANSCIFAFASASYALRTALGNSIFVLLNPMVYSTLIMFIDREIVSANLAKNKRMVATRLVLAVFIGLVILFQSSCGSLSRNCGSN